MKILIAPSSFKECADSVTIAEIIFHFLSKKIEADYSVLPVSDGGDGFLNTCHYYINGELLTYLITTPYGDTKSECKILYDEKTRQIYIESADILGLKVIPEEKRDPIHLSSKGLGELLKQLEKETTEGKLNINKVFVGIGGTGTIDMGLGACSVFGLKIFDENNKELTIIPKNFYRVKSVRWEQFGLPFTITFVLDVNNPLLGESGGIKIYGKQKSASENDLKLIEEGIGNILNVIHNQMGINTEIFLSGAGGGIPAGLKIFLGAKDLSAKKFILDYLKLKSAIKTTDILITGEGSFDEQSFMGKGTGILIEEAEDQNKQIILICGKISDKSRVKIKNRMKIIELRKFFKNDKESIKNYKKGIQKAVEVISEELLKKMKN